MKFLLVILLLSVTACRSLGNRPDFELAANPIVDKTKLWEGAMIRYLIDDSCDFYQEEMINSAISHIDDKTILKFEKMYASRSNSGKYLDITCDTAYLNDYAMAQASVGQISLRELILGANSDEGTVLHELGHVIGLHHEHQRADRDDPGSPIKVNMGNIREACIENFKKLDRKEFEPVGDLDVDSIMLYSGSRSSCAIDSTVPTIVNKHTGEPTVRSSKLSKGDIEGINRIYRDLKESSNDVTKLVNNIISETNSHTSNCYLANPDGQQFFTNRDYVEVKLDMRSNYGNRHGGRNFDINVRDPEQAVYQLLYEFVDAMKEKDYKCRGPKHIENYIDEIIATKSSRLGCRIRWGFPFPREYGRYQVPLWQPNDDSTYGDLWIFEKESESLNMLMLKQTADTLRCDLSKISGSLDLAREIRFATGESYTVETGKGQRIMIDNHSFRGELAVFDGQQFLRIRQNGPLPMVNKTGSLHMKFLVHPGESDGGDHGYVRIYEIQK